MRTSRPGLSANSMASKSGYDNACRYHLHHRSPDRRPNLVLETAFYYRPAESRPHARHHCRCCFPPAGRNPHVCVHLPINWPRGFAALLYPTRITAPEPFVFSSLQDTTVRAPFSVMGYILKTFNTVFWRREQYAPKIASEPGFGFPITHTPASRNGDFLRPLCH